MFLGVGEQKMSIEVFIIGGSVGNLPIKRRRLGRYWIPHDYTFDRFLVRMQQATGCSSETLLVYLPSQGGGKLRPVKLTDTPRTLGMIRPTGLDDGTVPEIFVKPLLKNSPPTRTPYHMNEPSDDQ